MRRNDAEVGFGAFLREQRVRRGMTQRQLADLSTLSVRAIRDLETERVRRPRQETVRLIADGLRLDTDGRKRLEALALPGVGDRPGRVPDADGVGVPPLVLSPIIAREVECQAIVDTLSDESGRLVSIAGLPGIGKTRVALEVALRVYERENLTVMWAAGPRSAGSHGLPEAARELRGLPEMLAGAIFGRSRGRLAATARVEVAKLARERPVMLVLDGAGAGGRPDRDVLMDLLREAPGLRILGTARASYRVPGERNFVLGPLSLPTKADEVSPDTLAEVASVRLFLAKAALVRPEYRLTPADAPIVAEICRRSDGIPMVLELLAPWLAVYDLAGLLRMLEQDPLGLLAPVQDAAPGQGLYVEALERVMRPLGPTLRGLLDWLCCHGPAELDEVASVLGLNRVECAAWMRNLVVNGLVRTEQHDGRTDFAVLHVVTALLRRKGRDGVVSASGHGGRR